MNDYEIHEAENGYYGVRVNGALKFLSPSWRGALEFLDAYEKVSTALAGQESLPFTEWETR